MIHIALLREYFMLEFKDLNGKLKFRFSLERIIDDFIFFCFFIGNDFLPSLSALDIADGSLDKLIDFYKSFLPTLDDYITESGVIHWDRAEKFIELLGQHESQVFAERIDEIEYSGRRDNRKGNDRRNERELAKTVTVSAEQQLLLDGETGGDGALERDSSWMQNMYRDAIFQKKLAKVRKYEITQGGKKYKKYLISKKFREDEEGKGRRLTKNQRDDLNAKLQGLYTTQKEAAK